MLARTLVVVAGLCLAACNLDLTREVKTPPVKPVAAGTSSTAKPPASDDAQGPGTGGGTPPPATPAYAGVTGPLPAELCGTGDYVSIAQIEPSPLRPLPGDTFVTVAATLSYALLETDTVTLVAIGFDTGTGSYSAPVTLAAGCGEAAVSFSMPTTGESEIIVMAESAWAGPYMATYLTYDVGDGPLLEITHTSVPVGSVVPAGAQYVTVSLSYDTFGAEGWLTAYTYPAYEMVADYALTEPTGSLDLTLPLDNPNGCDGSTLAVIGLQDMNTGTMRLRTLYWYLRPTLVFWGYLEFVASPDDAPLTDTVWAENCTGENVSATVGTSAAWLQAAPTTIALGPNGYANIDVTVTPAGLAAGMHEGALWADTGVESASLPASLAILDSTAYAATPASFVWDTAADAGNGTLLFDTGADEESAMVSLPFDVTLFGAPANALYVGMNGFVSLDDVPSYCCQHVPSASFTRTVFVDFDDHEVGAGQSVRYATVGAAPDRRFVLSFNGVQIWYDNATRDTFQIVFFEGRPGFRVQYGAMGQLGDTGIGDGAYIYTAWPAAGNTAFDVGPQ
jgi:hypothetical protein